MTQDSQEPLPLKYKRFRRALMEKLPLWESDEYAANILRTALFTVIVCYIFTSCREYPANKVSLTKNECLQLVI